MNPGIALEIPETLLFFCILFSLCYIQCKLQFQFHVCVSDVDCSWSGTSHRRPRFTKYTHISLTIKIRFSLSQYSLKTYAQTHTQTAWARATHLHFSSQSLSALSPAHKTTQQLTHKQTNTSQVRQNQSRLCTAVMNIVGMGSTLSQVLDFRSHMPLGTIDPLWLCGKFPSTLITWPAHVLR